MSKCFHFCKAMILMFIITSMAAFGEQQKAPRTKKAAQFNKGSRLISALQIKKTKKKLLPEIKAHNIGNKRTKSHHRDGPVAGYDFYDKSQGVDNDYSWHDNENNDQRSNQYNGMAPLYENEEYEQYGKPPDPATMTHLMSNLEKVMTPFEAMNSDNIFNHKDLHHEKNNGDWFEGDSHNHFKGHSQHEEDRGVFAGADNEDDRHNGGREDEYNDMRHNDKMRHNEEEHNDMKMRNDEEEHDDMKMRHDEEEHNGVVDRGQGSEHDQEFHKNDRPFNNADDRPNENEHYQAQHHENNERHEGEEAREHNNEDRDRDMHDKQDSYHNENHMFKQHFDTDNRPSHYNDDRPSHYDNTQDNSHEEHESPNSYMNHDEPINRIEQNNFNDHDNMHQRLPDNHAQDGPGFKAPEEGNTFRLSAGNYMQKIPHEGPERGGGIWGNQKGEGEQYQKETDKRHTQNPVSMALHEGQSEDIFTSQQNLTQAGNNTEEPVNSSNVTNNEKEQNKTSSNVEVKGNNIQEFVVKAGVYDNKQVISLTPSKKTFEKGRKADKTELGRKKERNSKHHSSGNAFSLKNSKIAKIKGKKTKSPTQMKSHYYKFVNKHLLKTKERKRNRSKNKIKKQRKFKQSAMRQTKYKNKTTSQHKKLNISANDLDLSNDKSVKLNAVKIAKKENDKKNGYDENTSHRNGIALGNATQRDDLGPDLAAVHGHPAVSDEEAWHSSPDQLLEKANAYRQRAEEFQGKAKELENQAEVQDHQHDMHGSVSQHNHHEGPERGGNQWGNDDGDNEHHEDSDHGHMGHFEPMWHGPGPFGSSHGFRDSHNDGGHDHSEHNEHGDHHGQVIHFNTGYPYYHVPEPAKLPLIEYHKPDPPIHGLNPYEVITSEQLHRPRLPAGHGNLPYGANQRTMKDVKDKSGSSESAPDDPKKIYPSERLNYGTLTTDFLKSEYIDQFLLR